MWILTREQLIEAIAFARDSGCDPAEAIPYAIAQAQLKRVVEILNGKGRIKIEKHERFGSIRKKFARRGREWRSELPPITVVTIILHNDYWQSLLQEVGLLQVTDKDRADAIEAQADPFFESEGPDHDR